MSLVFKVNDTVFHPTSGKGRVLRVAISTHPYSVKFDGAGDSCWVREECLSFTPWTAPNHVRPIQEGLHIIKYDQYEYLAIWNGVHWRWALGDAPGWDGTVIIYPDKVQSVKFLSELPKN